MFSMAAILICSMRDLSIANRPSLVLPRPCSQLVSPLRGFSQLANKTYIYFGKRNLVPLQTFSSPFVGRVGEASGSLDTPAERRPHLFGIFKSHMPSPVIPLYITKDLEVFVVEQSPLEAHLAVAKDTSGLRTVSCWTSG